MLKERVHTGSGRLKLRIPRGDLLLLLVAALLIGTPVRGESRASLRIGYIGSLSGFAAPYGQAVLAGVQLAVEEVVAQGQSVELFIEDDSSDTRTLVSAWQKLHSVNRIDALVTGSWWANSLVPAVARTGIPFLSCETVRDSATRTAANHFILAGDLRDWVRAFEPVIAAQAFRRAAVIRFTSGFGETIAGAMQETFSTPPRQFAGDLEYTDIHAGELASLVLRLRHLQPDVVYLDAQPESFAVMLRRLGELGLGEVPLFTNMVAESALRQGLVTAAQLSHTVFTRRAAISAGFAARYVRRFNRAPELSADLGYYAVRLVVEAARRGDPVVALRAGLSEIDGIAFSFSPEGVLRNVRQELCMIDPAGEVRPWTPVAGR